MSFEWPPWLDHWNMLINYVGSFGIIVPTVMGRRRWDRLSSPMRAVWWYCLFWSLEAPVNLFCRKVLHNNRPMYHIDVLAETLLLAWAYYLALGAQHPRRWLLGGAAFTAIAVADATVLSGIWEMNVYAHTAETILLVVLIMFYFERWVHMPERRIGLREGMFYVSSGQMIYLTGSITGYVLMPMATSRDLQVPLGAVIDLLFLVCLGLLIEAFRVEGKRASAGPAQMVGQTLSREVSLNR
ncbi:hypothetical protein LJ737_14175 [Hymenobacter sp. 15J16-1T3B]|uniref:hypothetical protein n=1 Tax=Hymenobacter sp. 15J16-1T3B TaxID=2886941 RepID=UPI001D10C36E|nr:hypothetical protein [Hymenobacter sp. 15J16-1T3B]MCC3158392.1 hypothetical protein [Hymenobacter sp. 15J16-1T3B]